MDDGLLVCVLNRLANGPKQPEPLVDGSGAFPAVFGDGFALDVVHDEPGRSIVQRAGVMNLCDQRMLQF